MPKDNIERAIKKATGDGADQDFQEIRYEGYGPGGIAVIVEALTDNRNRTAAEVRSLFNKYGGSMGETNSVSFMFAQVGEIAYPSADRAHEEVFEAAVEAGADDVQSDDTEHVVITTVDGFAAVRDALEQALGVPDRSGLVWRPNTTTAVGEEDKAQSVLKFLDALDDNDDVQRVSANFEIADDIVSRLTA